MDTELELPQPDKAQLLSWVEAVIGPDPSLGAVVSTAAVGITLDAWRNSPVEDWHSEGRISDGSMMRISSLTTWEIVGCIQNWCAEVGLQPTDTMRDLEKAGSAEFDSLATSLLMGITDRFRVLADHRTLGEVAGGDLGELREHAEAVFGTMMLEADQHGVAYPILSASFRGAHSKWWGAPTWPSRVDTFVAALDNQAHPHWRGDPARFPKSFPSQAADRTELKQLLLDKPWELDEETAGWVIRQGLNYVSMRSGSQSSGT